MHARALARDRCWLAHRSRLLCTRVRDTYMCARVMQQQKRAKNELTDEMCKLLLKTHVDSLDDAKYKSDDMDLVVKRYVGFLSAVAQHTSRLSKDMVKANAADIFGCSAVVSEKFGSAMKTALSYCHSKGTKATSGKRLTESVKGVVLSFKSEGTLLGTVQAKMLSPDDPKKASPRTQVSDDDVEGVAGNSKSSSSRVEDIYNLYGCPAPKKLKSVSPSTPQGAVEIVSSQEAYSDQDSEEPLPVLISIGVAS